MAKKKSPKDIKREEEVTELFQGALADFFTVNSAQRREIISSYMYMDCHRYQDNGQFDTSVGIFGRQKQDPKKRSSNIALLPAIIRAVAGSEVMQERHIDIVPIDNPSYKKDADIMDKAVEYAQYSSGWKPAWDIAKRDAAICGLGATTTFLDMTETDAMSGKPECRRIHPLFLFYDNSGCGQELNKTANWCGYADPMKIKDLQAYAEEKLGDDIEGAEGDSYMAQFLYGMMIHMDKINLLYHFFWKENETVKDVENPMETDPDLQQTLSSNDVALEFMARWAEDARVNISAPYWTLTTEQYSDLEKTLEAIQNIAGGEFKLNSSARFIKCFYRAEFAFGKLLTWSRSYSQHEYPINFVTGYYDTSLNIFYGFARPLSFVQDALNIVFDDLLEYSHDSVTGGKVWIKGVGDDLKALKASKANEDDITPIPENAEITPKALASSPQTLLATAQLLIDMMPKAIGVGQEFLGIITSGDMTDSLYGKVVRQSFAVLQDFANSSSGYSRRQGNIFIDLMGSIAEVENGRILPILSPGYQKEDYFALTRQNIARQYVIRVMERPVTDDERMENMRILIQLSPNMQQAGINILPAIIENMRISEDMREKLMQMASPPPQQPDRNAVAQVQANTRLINAQAADLEMRALLGKIDSALESEKAKGSIAKDVSTSVFNMAKAGATQKQTAIQAVDSITNMMRGFQ